MIMGNNVVDLSKFKKGPSAALSARAGDAGSLADGVGGSYGIIYYRGKVWTLKLRGQTYTFRRPDDGTAAASIKFVIVRDPGRKAKQYYPDWKDGAERKPPICASLDGITPNADVPEKQSDSCALCPRNVGRRDAEGFWKKECQDHKRLAVLLHPDCTAPLFNGEALMDPVLLRVPAGSLTNLAAMGKEMDDMGYPYFAYLTEAKFEEGKSYPKMEFQAIDVVSGEEEPVILKTLDHPDVKRITGEDIQAKMAQIASPKPVTAITFGQPVAKKIAAPAVEIKAPAPLPEPVTIDVTPTVVQAPRGFASAKPLDVGASLPPASNGGGALPDGAPTSSDEGENPPTDANLDAVIAQMANAVKGNG